MTELERVVRASVRLSKITRQTYLRTARRFVAFAGENPQNWTPRKAAEFLNSLNVSPRSYAAYLAHLKFISKRASIESNGLIQNFAADLEQPKYNKDRQKIRSLTQEEVDLVLNAYSSKKPLDVRNKAIIGLGLTTGMRRSSLHKLDLEHIDLHSKQITIALKGGGSFNVPLRKDSWRFLKPWIALLRARGFTTGPLFRAVYPDVTEQRFAYDSYRGLIDDIRERTGIADLHMHTFRHTFITRARELGWSSLEIAAVTGHVTDLKTGESSVINTVYTDLAGVAARHPRMDETLWADKEPPEKGIE